MRIGISGLAVGHPAGLGRLSRTYLLALAQCAPDWELHVYFRSRRDLGLLAQESAGDSQFDLEDQLRSGRIVAHFPPVPGINRLLLEEFDLPRRFGRLKLDAYLGCDFTLPPSPLAGRELTIIPDLLPFTQPATVAWRARWLYRRGILRSINRGATLLCISSHTRQALAGAFPDLTAPVEVIRPALSPRLLNLAQRSRSADIPLQVHGTLHSVTSPGPYILSVGVSGSRKNTALLVSVYQHLVQSGAYSGSLILAGGDGRYHTAPHEHVLALETAHGQPRQRGAMPPAIHDLGRVSDTDLSQLYRDAGLLVSLSNEEGFGYPVLEALAHGTPALVTTGSPMAGIAPGGIATTGLRPEECARKLVTALGALPLLRQEASALPLENYSIARLGRDLRAVIAEDAVTMTTTSSA